MKNINLKLIILGVLFSLDNTYAKNISIDSVAVQLVREQQINVFVKNMNYLKNFIFNDIKEYQLKHFKKVLENVKYIYYKPLPQEFQDIYQININNILNPFNHKPLINNVELIYNKTSNSYDLVFNNINIPTYYKFMFKKLIPANVKFSDNNSNIAKITYSFLPFQNNVIHLITTLNVTNLPSTNINKFWYKYSDNKISIFKYENGAWKNIGNIFIDNKNLEIKSKIFLDNVKDLSKLPTNINWGDVKVKANNNYYINYVYDKKNGEWMKKEIQDTSFKGTATIKQIINELYNSDNETEFKVNINGVEHIFTKTILPSGNSAWQSKDNEYIIFDNVYDMLKAYSNENNIKSGILNNVTIFVKDLYTNQIKSGSFYSLLNNSLHLVFNNYQALLNINSSYLSQVILYDVKDNLLLKKVNDYFKTINGNLYISLTNRDAFSSLEDTNIPNNTLFLTKENDCNDANCYTFVPVKYQNGFYYFYYTHNSAVKNKNFLSNLPSYNDITNGINSNTKYFVYTGTYKIGQIPYLSIVSQTEVNGKKIYEDYKNKRYINNVGYYFPMNYVPQNVDGNVQIDYSFSLRSNYLKVNKLTDIVLDTNIPKNYPVYFYSISKLLQKCNPKGEHFTLWSDNCNNISNAKYAITSGTRENLPIPSNRKRINLTYTNEVNKLNFYGLKFDKDNNFYQWYYVPNKTINEASAYYYKNIPLSSYIVNNMVDAKYVDSIWGNADMDDKTELAYGTFTKNTFAIDKNNLLGNAKILGLKKYVNIAYYSNIDFNYFAYALPDNINYYFPENTDILFPVDIKNKTMYSNLYGNNIQIRGVSNYTIKKDFDKQYIEIDIGNSIDYLKNKLQNIFLFKNNNNNNNLKTFYIIIPNDKNSYLDRLIKLVYTGYLKIDQLQKNGIWKTVYIDNDTTSNSKDLLNKLIKLQNENFSAKTKNLKNNNYMENNIYLRVTTSSYNLDGMKIYFGRFYFIPEIKEDLSNNAKAGFQEKYFIKSPNSDVIYYRYNLGTINDTYGPNIWYK